MRPWRRPRRRRTEKCRGVGLDVCICTHGPRAEALAPTIAALARQTAAPAFRVLLVDNPTEPPIPDAVLDPLRAGGIPARMVREPVLGNASARLRAIAETRYARLDRLLRHAWREHRNEGRGSLPFALGLFVLHLGARAAHRKADRAAALAAEDAAAGRVGAAHR